MPASMLAESPSVSIPSHPVTTPHRRAICGPGIAESLIQDFRINGALALRVRCFGAKEAAAQYSHFSRTDRPSHYWSIQRNTLRIVGDIARLV